jgi:ubiquinone/menaquinone biosynthesis C-methylase UbiE
VSFYEDKVLPRLINVACGSKPAYKQREKIVPRALRHIFALEPAAGMRKIAARPIADSGLDIELIDLPGEEIPLDDDSVDTVLVTYTLCTIAEVASALDGMRRVLKPNGKLLYCEHGKAPDASVVRWQNRLNPGWRKFAGGCNMNRDIPKILTSAGFNIEDDNRMYIPGIKSLSYNYWGAAIIR